MANGSLTVSDAKSKIERLQARLANMKQDAQRAAQLGIASTVVVAGAALAGGLDAKLPALSTGSGDVKPSVVLGSGLIVLSMLGLIDDERLAEQVALGGAGMLSPHAYDFTAKLLT